MKNSKKILIIMLLGFLLFSCDGKKVIDQSSFLNESSITSSDESTTTSIDSNFSTSCDDSFSSDEEKSSENIVDGDKLQSDWNWE